MQLVKKTPTKDEILEKLSEYDIYKYELSGVEIGRSFCNPFRKDEHPSMGVFVGEDGRWHHRDLADDQYRGDAWDLVCQKYGIDLPKAIEHVAKVFGLADGSNQYKEIVSQYSKPVMDQKRHSLLQVTSRRWHKSDFSNYWDRYRVIGEQKLKKHHVYPVKELFLNRRRIPIGKDEMVWGYWYENGWKIMFPERERIKKWLSNIPLDTPEGLENLSKDHNTLLVKSKKCLMVMEEVYQYLAAFQNESLGSVSDKTAQYINENSKEVWYGGDSDKAGKIASYRITEKHMWHHVNTPDPLLPVVKDWSDWVAHTGSLEPIREHLIKKKIIT